MGKERRPDESGENGKIIYKYGMSDASFEVVCHSFFVSNELKLLLARENLALIV